MAMPMPAEWSFAATIPAKDMEGTRRFYEDVLGAQVLTEDPGGILYRSGDSTFSLYPTEFAGTAQHTLGAFMVRDVEAVVADLRSKGVTFEEYDLPGVKTADGIAELGGFRGPGSKTPRATSCRWWSRQPDADGSGRQAPSLCAPRRPRPRESTGYLATALPTVCSPADQMRRGQCASH
jgi:hypothetical protein